LGRGKGSLRHWVQAGWTVLTNGYLSGFAGGTIYRGPLKKYCVPGLSCYSCPGALGACPIGSLQAVLGSRNYRFTFYVVGFLFLVGALLGRFVCGWLCPFGLIQDLLHKLPLGKKLRRLPGEKVLRLLRYGILLGFVILAPLYLVDFIGQGQPWFCKYICPAGTLTAGLPLVAANSGLWDALGWLFAWKNLVLLFLVLLSIPVYRPFCRYLCPLGAVYGLFNPIAFRRFQVNEASCTSCGACQRACKLDIPVWKTPNSPDCIRCGDCQRACPRDALGELGLLKNIKTK
jgi:ferredoxin-type protein NapH